MCFSNTQATATKGSTRRSSSLPLKRRRTGTGVLRSDRSFTNNTLVPEAEPRLLSLKWHHRQPDLSRQAANVYMCVSVERTRCVTIGNNKDRLCGGALAPSAGAVEVAVPLESPVGGEPALGRKEEARCDHGCSWGGTGQGGHELRPGCCSDPTPCQWGVSLCRGRPSPRREASLPGTAGPG